MKIPKKQRAERWFSSNYLRGCNFLELCKLQWSSLNWIYSSPIHPAISISRGCQIWNIQFKCLDDLNFSSRLSHIITKLFRRIYFKVEEVIKLLKHLWCLQQEQVKLAAQKSDEESEHVAEQFLNGEMDLDTFLSAYTQKRMVSATET